MEDQLFYLEGPDEHDDVWISSTGALGWHHNLGAADRVAEVLVQWLASTDAENVRQVTQDE